MENYSVDYFIKKFEAIPEEKWCILSPCIDDKHCAAGHCGLRWEDVDSIKDTIRDEQKHQEVVALGTLLSPLSGTKKPYRSIYLVNDMNVESPCHLKYNQPTPKQRILAALYDIKKLNQGTGTSTERRNEVQSELQTLETKRKNITKSLATLPPEERVDVKEILIEGEINY